MSDPAPARPLEPPPAAAPPRCPSRHPIFRSVRCDAGEGHANHHAAEIVIEADNARTEYTARWSQVDTSAHHHRKKETHGT